MPTNSEFFQNLLLKLNEHLDVFIMQEYKQLYHCALKGMRKLFLGIMESVSKEITSFLFFRNR